MAMTAVEPGLEKGLGQRIQAARQQAGLTQQQLCQKAGLSYSTLAKIERGAIKAPSIFTIQQLASVLGTPLEALVGMSVTPPARPSKRTSKSGIKFVYFDINGCLVRFFHRAFTQIAEDSDVAADIIETTFWHYNDAVCRGEMAVDEFNEILGKRFKLSHFDWRDYYLQAIDPIDEMRELVRWATEHYHVGLLSNIMPGQIDTLLEKHILPHVQYSAVVDSSEVHAIKPEPKIYEVAQEKAGCEPNEILLVDDSRTNLMAAEHCGWHVLWFDDFRPAESADRVRDALEIAD